MGWWAGSHGLAAAAVLHAPLGGAATAVLLIALTGHAYRQWPRPLGRIVRSRSGFWALPDAGRTGLTIASATRYGNWWVDLRLRKGRGAVRVLLCRDQLGPDAWRLLQVTLRHGTQPDCHNGRGWAERG